MIHRIAAQSKEACRQKSRNAMNESCKKILHNEQAKNIAAEGRNTSDTLSNLLVNDCEEVASVIATTLPALDVAEPKEVEDTSDGPKGGRPKNTTSKKSRHLSLAITVFINEVATKCNEGKKNCVKKLEDDNLMEQSKKRVLFEIYHLASK